MDKITGDVWERIGFFTVSSYFVANFLWLIGFNFYLWFTTFVLITSTVVVLIDRILVNPKGKAVFITGCDTGFGNASARRLHKLGFHVIAGVLYEDKDGAAELKKLGIDVISVDVTKDFSTNALEDALKKKSSQLWAVITNAGLSSFGQVEWVSMETYDKILQVNLLGTVRTIKTVLPLLRRSKGRVITVASMLGRFGAAGRSPYSPSKWAVEGFSECLRMEMKRWGVHVSVIEPGNFIAGTAIFEGDAVKRTGEKMWSELSELVRKDYGQEYFENQIQIMAEFVKNGNKNIEPVVQTMVDAVSHSFPQTRYVVMNGPERIRLFAATHLPTIMYDALYN